MMKCAADLESQAWKKLHFFATYSSVKGQVAWASYHIKGDRIRGSSDTNWRADKWIKNVIRRTARERPRSMCREEANIKLDFWGTGTEGVKWIQLDLDRFRRKDFWTRYRHSCSRWKYMNKVFLIRIQTESSIWITYSLTNHADSRTTVPWKNVVYVATCNSCSLEDCKQVQVRSALRVRRTVAATSQTDVHIM
jgi:hypothetical protein